MFVLNWVMYCATKKIEKKLWCRIMGEKLLDNNKTIFEKSDSRFGISAAPKKLNIVFLVQSKGKLKKIKICIFKL